MNSLGWLANAGVIAFLSTTLIASRLVPNRIPEKLRAPLDTIGKDIEGWRMLSADEFDFNQFFATSYIARTYSQEDRRLALLVAYHDSHQGAVNVHNPKNCLPADGWEIWKSESAGAIFNGQPVVINQYHISKGDQRRIVLYWYQSRKRVIANDLVAKMMLIRDAVTEGRTSGAFVRIVMPEDTKSLRSGLQFAGVVMYQLELCFRP